MRTVLTYGTFDLFHVGHVRLLRRLRAMGDQLVVGCSTDEFNAVKGKKSIFSYEERTEILASCQYVDVVFPENSWEQKLADIVSYKVSILAMGDDWVGKFDHLANEGGCTVTYLSRTPDISTTQVKDIVGAIVQEKKSTLLAQASTLLEQIEML